MYLMLSDVLLPAFLMWLVFLVLMVFNGNMQKELQNRSMSGLKAHQLSSLVFIIIIFAGTFLFLQMFDLVYSKKELLITGLTWVALNLIFDVLVGLILMRKKAVVVFNDYNILKGRLWTVAQLAYLSAPLIIGCWLSCE